MEATLDWNQVDQLPNLMFCYILAPKPLNVKNEWGGGVIMELGFYHPEDVSDVFMFLLINGTVFDKYIK